MTWWMWIALGAVFFIAEMVLSTDFYLVFFGASALVVGFLALLGIVLPEWMAWLLFAGLAILSLVFYRKKLREILFNPDAQVDEEIVGKPVSAIRAVPVGGAGQVEFRGTVWKARNIGEESIDAGDRCRVDRVEGVTLLVRKIS